MSKAKLEEYRQTIGSQAIEEIYMLAGRAQDKADDYAMQKLRVEGYM